MTAQEPLAASWVAPSSPTSMRGPNPLRRHVMPASSLTASIVYQIFCPSRQNSPPNPA